jgi:hypothetical protein
MSRTPQLFNSRAVDSRSDNCSCFKSARRAEEEEKDVPEVLAPPANDDAPILIDLVSPTLGWCLPLEARAPGESQARRAAALPTFAPLAAQTSVQPTGTPRH